MTSEETVVLALGGNAISQEGEEGNIYQQFTNTRRSMDAVLDIVAMGKKVLITHGNGPQVGNELIRVESALSVAPDIPLGVLVGDTQGGMGYMIEQCLVNMLHDRGMDRQTACLITQTLVDPADPSFRDPDKFVGRFYHEGEAREIMSERGWRMKEDKGRGWRRVVPSPQPLSILQKDIIRLLLDRDILVVAAGGGGVPVYLEDNGWLEGVDAVVDKDLASAVLGNEIGAQTLMILTGVEKVALDFATPQQRFVDRLTLQEARQYLKAGQFPAGSMGPKIRAAIRFLENGGRRVIITSIEKASAAISGDGGTTLLAED